MRFIHTSDWHLGKNLEGRSRIEEQRKFCKDFIEIVKEKQVDLVIIAGDVYDTHNPSAEAEKLFYDTISKIAENGERCVFIISGNHDNPDRLSAITPLAQEQGIIVLGKPYSQAQTMDYKGYKIVDAKPGMTKLIINGEKVNIASLPYPSEKRLNEIIYTISEDSKKSSEEELVGTELKEAAVTIEESHDKKMQKTYSQKVGEIFKKLEEDFEEEAINIAVSHIFVVGGETSESERPIQLGGSLLVEKKDLPRKSDYIALGHLHKPQRISEYVNAYYSGSPLQYSKDERNYAKGAYVVDIKAGENPIVEKIYFNNYKPIEVFSAKGIDEAIKICQENKERDIWSFFEIETDKVISALELKEMKDLLKDIIEIKPILKNVKNYDSVVIKEKGMAEIFRDFYSFTRGVEPKGELMDIFMEIVSEGGQD
ncbi:MAG: exonuclease subunit SbcD [Clostridioides sp.]|jgi:exonuclease SbcD|nr:exonuclease subunit SbcD [Clostridioides sp.]